LSACGGADAARYDLILRTGTIHDGSGAASVTGDVAIQGDSIAAIVEERGPGWTGWVR
jgi:N-acyl-D-amino-acid deacylase